MRALKFRIWDEIFKFYVGEDELYLGITFDGKCLIYQDEITDEVEFTKIDNFIVEQYTGLKDKNGKEIYVGDIVKIISEPWFEPNIGVVGFNEDKGIYDIYTIEHNKKYWAAGKDFCSCMAREGWTSEVIGNIHESNMEELCPKE